MAQSEGRDAFVSGARAMFPILERLAVRELIVKDDTAVAIYDFECAEPIGGCSTSDVLTIDGGAIRSSEVFFDARPFEAAQRARGSQPAST